MNVAALFADLDHCVDIIQTNRIEEEIGLEARGVAFVAESHRLQVPILDERALVLAAVTTENVATMPAVVLANDDGEVSVAGLAPEHSLILNPARTLVTLFRLLELLQWPA